MKKKVLVGMSGGVDSSVAAAILKEMGHEVTGVTMEIWGGEYAAQFKQASREKKGNACFGPGEENDIEDAKRIATILEIPFFTIDVKREYNEHVIDYFKREYLEGRTPNPCVRCNQRIKFGYLLKKARALGIDFDFFATGHYAQVYFDERRKRYGLRKAIDLSKDQSYFLSFLEQNQLKQVLFPLGAYTKNEVRSIAGAQGLPVSEKEESQDFIEQGDYSILFSEKPEPGPIVDMEGKVRGTHKGIIHYTVGQRKGLGISDRTPLYVQKIDREKNEIVVGPVEKLYASRLLVYDVNWILTDNPALPLKAFTRLRLAHKEAESLITPLEDGQAEVSFGKPQRGITPGQVAVFYDEDRVLGGGIIGHALQ